MAILKKKNNTDSQFGTFKNASWWSFSTRPLHLSYYEREKKSVMKGFFIVETTDKVHYNELDQIFKQIEGCVENITLLETIKIGKKYKIIFGDPREVVGVVVGITKKNQLKIKVRENIYFYIKISSQDKLHETLFKEIK